MSGKTMLARALVSIAHLGVECGHLVEAIPAKIKELADAGQVDPHPEAVAYARSQGAKVAFIDHTEAELKAAIQATESEVATLTAAAEKAGEKAKVGIMARIEQARAWLASL